MKVFLSSTAVDLVAYREVADDTILGLSQQAVVMERFGPLPGEPVAECERKARECDVVVCLVAHRYGFEPEPGRGSITRREVEAARAAGKDVLVWIIADDHPWSEKKEQDRLTDPTVLADPAKVAAVAGSVQALQKFKSWLRASFVCDCFTTPDDLGKKIAVALGTYWRERAAGGLPAAAPARGEVRILHALQPAPHFHGREALLEELSDWAADLASPDRVWALVAPGGSGKTAVAERLVSSMEPGAANVLVWSFYERPDADAFLRECNQLFLGEEEGPAGGRLERLERGLRDGRPHLIVLDGLERVQEEAGGDRVRGELTDHTLKLLLRALANGLGRARALVTSRFPLVDLEDWSRRGYRDTRLDDLPPEAAVAVLGGWGVVGTAAALAQAAAQVGYHALLVAVIGSYLRSFAAGRIEAVADFDLDAVTGDDARAAKLARVLGFYAERLPAEERELLARLAVFPHGVSLELLGTLVDAGGEVGGLLVMARPRLLGLLNSLQERGLVFRYASPEDLTWTAHPFLRDRFRQLLGCRPEQVFEVVANALCTGLDTQPGSYPSDQAALDRYEQLIEAIRLTGRFREAFDLFEQSMGGYENLGRILGDYERGYRIASSFRVDKQSAGHKDNLYIAESLSTSLSLFARGLGRLCEAQAHLSMMEDLINPINYLGRAGKILLACDIAFDLGSLSAAQALADEAPLVAYGAYEKIITEKDIRDKREEQMLPIDMFKLELEMLLGNPGKSIMNSAVAELISTCYCYRARAAHAQGYLDKAKDTFVAATELGGGSLSVYGAAFKARHCLDLGYYKEAYGLIDDGLSMAIHGNMNNELPHYYSLLARLALAENSDPTIYIDAIRSWTSRTGDMQWVVNGHLLSARYFLANGNNMASLAEAELGLLHAETCGYSLLRIELLIALARIRLAWPDPSAAIHAARLALDLATAPECGFAWGEADAAQAWGEAYSANGELALAHLAFSRALAVRQRILHPDVEETAIWLARCS